MATEIVNVLLTSVLLVFVKPAFGENLILDPPSNLSVSIQSGKTATISWNTPSQENFTSFKLKITNITDSKTETITVDNIESSYILKHLTPGATYQVQAFTVFENKESAAYTSRNFTTKPNPPGKFIVWFRNETTLLALMQPPYPADIYTHYKVSINPPDANNSILYIEKEGEPPTPAQAAFNGLVPGKAYNITVQTISEEEISEPNTVQFRTVPLKPVGVSIDKEKITPNSFEVRWNAPVSESEFDKYEVSLDAASNFLINTPKEGPTFWEFKEGLEPGKSYTVDIKTVSGKVKSWPASAVVTLKPLAVKELQSSVDGSILNLSWKANPESTQDSYLISYNVESASGDSNIVTTNVTNIELKTLLPGRNYSVTVQAISIDMQSEETYINVVTPGGR